MRVLFHAVDTRAAGRASCRTTGTCFSSPRRGDGLRYANFLHVLDEGDIGNVARRARSTGRQGVADALLEALCARAAALNLAFLTLEVRASNAPAIALYRKHGFRPSVSAAITIRSRTRMHCS